MGSNRVLYREVVQQGKIKCVGVWCKNQLKLHLRSANGYNQEQQQASASRQVDGMETIQVSVVQHWSNLKNISLRNVSIRMHSFETCVIQQRIVQMMLKENKIK